MWGFWAYWRLHMTLSFFIICMCFFWVAFTQTVWRLSKKNQKTKKTLSIYQRWNSHFSFISDSSRSVNILLLLHDIPPSDQNSICHSSGYEWGHWIVPFARLASARVIISKSANLSPNGQSKQHLSDTRGHKWLKWCDKWFPSFSPGLPECPENGNERSPVNGSSFCVVVFFGPLGCVLVVLLNLAIHPKPQSCSRVALLE